MSIATLPDELTDEVLDSLRGAPQPCEWGTFKDRALLWNGVQVVDDFEECPETAVKFVEMTNQDPTPHRILVGLCAEHAERLGA